MPKNTKSLGIIPARYASSRFPGKPLVDILGKSMIQRVYEQVEKAHEIDTVVVATDDERIFNHVTAIGGKIVMTSKNHQSGTDRCAEVLEKEGLKDFQIIVNIQGDEPFIDPSQIDVAVQLLKNHPNLEIATLAKRIEEEEVLFNPNVVKVVFGVDQQALYFSRHPVPFLRNVPIEKWFQKGTFYKHIGLYAFQKKTLQKIAKLPQTPLEKAESLEQLRWLEYGFGIGVAITELESIGIDSPEDVQIAVGSRQ